MKMSQKKRIEELSEQDIRKTEITENVYLGGKVNVSKMLQNCCKSATGLRLQHTVMMILLYL